MSFLSKDDLNTVEQLSDRAGHALGAVVGVFPVAPLVYFASLQLIGEVRLDGASPLVIGLFFVGLLAATGVAGVWGIGYGLLFISPTWWLLSLGAEKQVGDGLPAGAAIEMAVTASAVGAFVGGTAYLISQAL